MADRKTVEQYLTIEQRAKIYCDEIPLSVSMYNPNIEHYCYEGIVKVATEVTKELNKKLSQTEADYDKMFWQKNEIISNLQVQIEKMKNWCNCKNYQQCLIELAEQGKGMKPAECCCNCKKWEIKEK